MQWFALAALGEALTGIVAGAGLLAGVWFMARGSRANDGVSSAASASPEPVAEPAEPDEPAASPATTFRHGAIRLAGEPVAADVATAPEPEPEAAPEPAPEAAPTREPAPGPGPGPAPAPPEPEPEPGPDPEAAPAAAAYVPPPMAPAPRTSFRQGRIRLGGLERGITRDPGGPPGAA